MLYGNYCYILIEQSTPLVPFSRYEWGGIQNLELSNVEQPIFRNLKITNIKIAKEKSFDYFIY